MLKELPFRLFWVENTETLLFCFFSGKISCMQIFFQNSFFQLVKFLWDFAYMNINVRYYIIT